MKHFNVILTEPATKVFANSIRKYQNFLIFTPIDYHNDFFATLELFAGSLKLLDIKFTINTNFDGIMEPLLSFYKQRRAEQPLKLFESPKTLQLPKLKKLVLDATDFVILKFLQGFQLEELILEESQDGFGCEDLIVFLKNQNQLKVFHMDRDLSKEFFVKDVSQTFNFQLRTLQLEYGRYMPWKRASSLENLHKFWRSQQFLEKICLDMHNLQVDDHFANLLSEMKNFKGLKLILGSDKFGSHIEIPKDIVVELELQYEFTQGSRTKKRISAQLLQLCKKFTKTKKICFNALRIDASIYDLLADLNVEEICFKNCQIVKYQHLKAKKLVFENMGLRCCKSILNVNRQVTHLIVDDIEMKDFLRARLAKTN